MKIVITIILAFLSGLLFSQTPFPVNSTNGTSTTTNLTRGIAAADSAFQYRTYFLDTVSANRGRIDEVPGVMIRTAPNVIWLRNSTATAWIRQANINDIINITGCYALLNGGLVSWSGSGLTMDVSAADYLINCKEYSTITSQVTLSTADATYDRFDIIYVDTNSTVGVITGTASATPIFPQIDPASQLQLAVISVPAGATTPGDVSSIVIYNEDIEWTSGSIMSSGTVDFVSTNNPFIGTYNALMSANANGVIYWDTANPININDYTTLKMYVRIDGGFDNDLAAYLVYLRSGGNPITNPIYLTDYGLDLSISGSYQIVTIPITAFTFAGSSSDVFDGVQLKFNNGSAALHIDYVQLQGGIPNGNSPYITNIFRVPGVDSIYFTKNGINYAIKDSIGSGGGSSYTFPYSVVAPGNAIQLENDTTANPANYFYGRNSAGRRGWYPQSGIAGVNLFNSDGTLTGNRTVDASNYNLKANNIGLFDFVSKPTYYTSTSRIRAFGAFDDAVGGGIMLSSTDEEGTDSSYIHVQEQNITINSRGGNLYIPNLNYTLSTTAKKIPIIDTASGYTYWIDPALIGGATPTWQQTLTAGSVLSAQYNTITQTGDFTYEHNVNSLASNAGFMVSSNSTTAASNTQQLFRVQLSGANSNSSQTTYAALIQNGHTGTSSTNIGLSVSSSGGTNNYAIVVPASSGNVGIGTSTPSSKAILDLTSTTQGALMPRMNTTQQNAISSPTTGLIIWNTDSLALVNYTGSAWLKVSQGGGGSSLFPLIGTGTATGNVTGALGSYDLSMTNSRGYLKFQNATNPLVNIQGTGNSPLFQVDSSSAVRFKVYAGGQIAAGDSSANLFIGHNSGLNIVNLAGPPGNWNISLGENVFEDLTIGNDMVGIGPNTFRRSIASFHSIGIGTGVGSNATHLEDVIGIGVDVLIGADTITRSTATGSYSQFKYTKAAGNTSSGFASQYGGAAGPWTGSYNTSDGNQSLNNITTGSYGSAYGDRSQFTLTTGGAGGGENASFGAFSAYTTNHSRGVYLGPFSGYFADEDDVLYVHNSYSGIADEAEGKAESMLYGKFGINGANQLRMNGKMGINTMPDASAALDVTSTTTGLLVPRMTTTQRNAISSPAVGLMIYNTTDSAFNYYRLSGWTAIGGGGGGTPGGSNTQIQFNNAGSFGGSSTFTYDLTTMKFGGNSLWLNSTFQPYHATNDKQLKITNSGTGAEGLFFSVSDVPKAFIESTSGYALKISSNGGGSYFELGTVGGIGVNKAASSLYALGVDGTIADNGNNGNYLIQPALFGNSPTKPSYSFFSDENSGMYWISADKFGFSTNGIKRASFSATKFDINEAANDYDVVIAGTTDANLIVTDASTNRVGIGTGSPDSKLHVVGSIKMVDGNQAADKVMVSDANGVGSWQALNTESTYTPTLTNTTNVAASTAYTTYYQRIGDVVRVWGEISIDATASLTVTELGLSLPIATAIGNTYELAGTGSFEDNTTVQIKGDVTNDRAMFRFYPQTDTNNRYSFHFTYKYIAP